jgi:hypothetical protein
MASNNNYHKGHKKRYQITRHRSLPIGSYETPLEDLDLEECRAKWERDTKIISEIVQFDNELARSPTMLDLLCRFDKWENAWANTWRSIAPDALHIQLSRLVKWEEGPN